MRQGCTLLWLMLVVSPCVLSAQDVVTITGSVFDIETEEPIPLVNVVVRASRIGTTTAADGSYSLQIPVGDTCTLVFSHIAYEKVALGITLRKPRTYELIQRMKPSSVRLPGVVVRGTTFREQRAIAMFDESDFEQVGETHIERALEYLMPFRFHRLEKRMADPRKDFTLYIDDEWYESIWLDDVHPFEIRRVAVWGVGMSPVGYPHHRGDYILAIWTMDGKWRERRDAR